MAATEPKFSHITVTTDDEDEVVIHAGARPSDAAAPKQPHGDEPTAASVAAPDAEPAASEAPVVEDGAKAKAKRASGEYRETTMDDLKGAPMSSTQKVILALAALGVLVILAYYFFLR